MDYMPDDRYSKAVGALLRGFISQRRKSVKDHVQALSPIIPDFNSRRDAEAAAFRFHALYYRQFFGMRPTTVVDPPSMTDMKAGRGVLFLTAHVGPWDSAARWLLETTGRPRLYVVAKEQPMRAVTKLVRHKRQAFGVYDVWASDPGGVAEECRRLLLANELVVIFADRNYWENRTNATLFGQPTSLPIGLIKQVCDTPDVVQLAGVTVWQSKDTCRAWRLEQSEFPMVDGTVDVPGLVESLVRFAPMQWHMFSRRW